MQESCIMAFKRKEKRKRKFQNFGNCHQCWCNRVGGCWHDQKLNEKGKFFCWNILMIPPRGFCFYKVPQAPYTTLSNLKGVALKNKKMKIKKQKNLLERGLGVPSLVEKGTPPKINFQKRNLWKVGVGWEMNKAEKRNLERKLAWLGKWWHRKPKRGNIWKVA